MINTEEFIALLEKKDLLSPELIEHLRRQTARPKARMSAALIAKWLVDHGHLSRLLAQRLLSKAEEPAPEAGLPEEGQFSWEKQAKADEEELGLAPLDDEIAGFGPPGKGKPAAKPEPPRRPAEPRPGAKPPREKAAGPPPPALAIPLSDQESSPVGIGPQPGRGPLDGLVDESSLTASDTSAGPLAPLGGRKRGVFGRAGKRKVGAKRSVWDTPLMLIGGGALLALVILFGILLWALRGRGADELFKLAEEDYSAGSYTQAIKKYDDFVERFPGHPEASRARVHRGLARLRQATDSTSDWSKALATANEVLGEIGQEGISEARAELAAMLPKIAQGLADQAHAKLDPTLVEKSEEALALVDKYVLSSARPPMLLDDIKALLALTNREIARDDELEDAVTAMNKAVEAGDTAQAYKIRAALLKEYPDLLDNEKLHQAVLTVSQAELAKVTSVEQKRPAEAAEPPKTMLATMVLARRNTQKAPPNAEGRVIYAVADGAAYGLDAASGKILWRHPVGFATNGRSLSFPPTPISEQAGSDAIMVDAEQGQLLRVEATTGRHSWRHAVEGPFDAHPVVAGDRLLVATRSGRLVSIELETGNSPGYIQLPQELRVAPAVDFRRSNLYQLAEHSNLFVLALGDGAPKQVVYLGHEPGTVTVAPVLVSRYLVVAENNGVDYATLRVLTLEAGEGPPVQVVQNVRLKGHVDAPPQVYGPQMLVATDQGELYVFEITDRDPKEPLVPRAQASASIRQKRAAGPQADALVRFPLLRGAQIWIADNQLTRYDLQATQGRLQPKEIQNERSATLQPLVAVGQTIFHVRRDVGVPGVLVSAVAPGQTEPLWETHLAAPLATEPVIDTQTGRITAVTSIGAMYQLQVADLEGQSAAAEPRSGLYRIGIKDQPEPYLAVDQPALALEPSEIREPLHGVVPLPDGLLAMVVGDGPTQLPVFDLREVRRFRLFLPDPLGGRPIAFAGGLLAPSRLGQVFLLDPRSSERRTEPFQPELKSGGRVAWSDPALVGEKELVLAEGRAGLYRIGIKDQPKPHLAALSQAKLDEPIVSPIAVLGQTVFAVDAGQSLVTFRLPDLAPGDPEPLEAEVVWGPRRVGDHVLLATGLDNLGKSKLSCRDADGQEVWKVDLPYGPLAGTPLEIDGTYLLAATGGVIWRVESATGKELAKIETGCPLGTGPVRLGDQLLVGGRDGSLYKVEQP